MKSTTEIGSDGIVYTKLADTDNLQDANQWAESLKGIIRQLYKKTNQKVKVLTDLTECPISMNVGVKQIISEMEKENEPYVDRSAAYTPNFALRNIANLLGKISRRRNFLVFKTKEEALEWLKSSKKSKNKEETIIETVHEVYRLLKDSPETSMDDVLDYVGKLHDYSKMETDEEFESYSLQQGAVLVAYNYLKTNPAMPEEEATKYILENYSELLDKYSSKD